MRQHRDTCPHIAYIMLSLVNIIVLKCGQMYGHMSCNPPVTGEHNLGILPAAGGETTKQAEPWDNLKRGGMIACTVG
jgi:hypothetical protein